MVFNRIEKNGKTCAIVDNEELVITDAQSALDLLANVNYEVGTNNIVISQKLITEDFFILRTRLAGDILQKFVNYNTRIAIYGDYSKYGSEPLKAFIYESNHGNAVFFTQTKDEAIEKLTQ